MKTQSGRSMLEIIGVLAIISVLSVGGLYAYKTAMNKRKVNDILNMIQTQSVMISTAMQNKDFKNADEMNAFLSDFNTKVAGYNITFEFPEDAEFNPKNYVSKITDESNQPIQGRMCRELMRSMMEQRMISDIGVTVLEDRDEDGVAEKFNLRLNGLSINLDAVCGTDSL